MKRLLVIGALIALAACGQKAALRPAPDAALPPAAYGADAQPSAEKLLALHPQAAPDRSVELRTRSEDREDDPFDLPPE
ncbi:MAG: hypothetical protein WC692_01345 [Erythrobacter sp.]|jgi:predicted small lipoprotein YifL